MQLKATQVCFACSNKFNLYYMEPHTLHGPEHGWYACPRHYAEGYRKQARADMNDEDYEAYCLAARNLYVDSIPTQSKKRVGNEPLKKLKSPTEQWGIYGE